jgi:PAS domain S-box-containing protein
MANKDAERGLSGLALAPIQQFLLYDAVDRSPALIFVADDQMKYLAVNHTACVVLGYTREEMLALSVTDIVVASEAPSLLHARSQDGSVELRKKSGELLPFAYQAAETWTAGMQYWVSIGFVGSRLLEKTQQLEAALESRIVIEQAKGVLAERHGIDVGTAFDALRRGARSNQLRVHDLASRVVRETRTPPELDQYLRSPDHV